jgi:hypothetical protein
VHVRVSVIWNYKAPEGGGDTHFSVMKGSLASLEIRQGPDEQFKPELYIAPVNENPEFEEILRSAISGLAGQYPGISVEKQGVKFHVLIPNELRIGHEAHFTQVTRNFLDYLGKGRLPDWEVPNMLAKYWLTTTAQKMANE